MTDAWYLARAGKQSGPYTVEQLRQLAAGGAMTATDLIWKQGMSNWVAASQVPGLLPAPAPRPPPPAAAAEPAEWHYVQGGKTLGPVTLTELRRLHGGGTLGSTDLVWKNGLAAWVAAGTVK